MLSTTLLRLFYNVWLGIRRVHTIFFNIYFSHLNVIKRPTSVHFVNNNNNDNNNIFISRG